MTILGVIADTHIPDRCKTLNPRIFEIFSAAKVAAILHAGDVCTPAIVDALQTVAPVLAVQGNRDIWAMPNLPLARCETFDGVRVGITHGHGGFWGYWGEKLEYVLFGYRLTRYFKRLPRLLPDADVLIWGHSHHAEQVWHNGKLFLNPGSACHADKRRNPPSIALLHIQNQQPRAQMIALTTTG